jgi:hypothetical protein
MLAVGSNAQPGQHVVPVDYDVYAAGEAALGWLNAAVKLNAAHAVDWREFVTDLMAALRRDLSADGAQIAHVKVVLAAGSGSVRANLVSNDAEVDIRDSGATASPSALMVVNARARTGPEQLRAAVEKCLRASADGRGVSFQVTELASLSPGRPTPVHRFDQPA